MLKKNEVYMLIYASCTTTLTFQQVKAYTKLEKSILSNMKFCSKAKYQLKIHGQLTNDHVMYNQFNPRELCAVQKSA